MSQFLKRKVNTVFLILGSSCNMNCRYCLQHPLVHEQLATEINPEIYEFFYELLEDNPNLHIQFFGGEPLLYFKAIREVVTRMEKSSLKFSVITNGKALTDEMVKFFNANDIWVTVSWDGSHSLETRGFDVLNVPELFDRFMALNHLSLTGVISACAYPKELLADFQKISNRYYEKHGYHAGVNLDEIFDTGITRKDLLKVDYKRIENEMSELASVYLSPNNGKDEYTIRAFVGGLFRSVKYFYGQQNGMIKRITSGCGNGIHTLNMDLAGNLYPCHNTSESVGRITDSYFGYLRRILLGEEKVIRQMEKCRGCLAAAFCRGGCKMVSDQEQYCRLHQAVFVPVLSALQHFGEIVGERDGRK